MYLIFDYLITVLYTKVSCILCVTNHNMELKMAKTNTLAKLAFTEVPGSSTIASFAQTGITPTTVGDMFVKFINGNTYKYSGVDMKTFAELKESASKGKYFSSNIRNKFVATKV